MYLEKQFSGPLRDTVIQRWKDPADGATCFVYLPITVTHSAVAETGFVQYGDSTIGSISCFPGKANVTQRAVPPAAPPPAALIPKQ
jgi:hypothetical protein